MSTKEERAKSILGDHVFGGDPFTSDPHPMHQEAGERFGVGGETLVVHSKGLLRAIATALPDGDLFTENALLKSALLSISSFVAFELNRHQKAIEEANEEEEDDDFSEGAAVATSNIRNRMIEELQRRGLSVDELTVFMAPHPELSVNTPQPAKLIVRPPTT